MEALTMNTQSKTARIILVHPSAVVRSSLSLMLEENGYQVVCSADSCNDINDFDKNSKIDLVLVHCSECPSGAVIKSLKRQTGAKIALIASSDSYHKDDLLTLEERVDEGISGLLDLNVTPKTFLGELYGICVGSFLISKGFANQLTGLLERRKVALEEELSTRETKIIELIASGKTNKEIGEELYISEHTVKAHVSTILSKLRLKNRQQVVAYAITKGLLHQPHIESAN